MRTDRNTILSSHSLYSPEDYAHECNAYMEIKHFLSNRITEQEKEIQMLKDLVLYHSSKHMEMYEWLKNINNILLSKLEPIKKKEKHNLSSLNCSAELIDSISLGEEPDLPDLDRMVTDLKNENLELMKQNEHLKTEICKKDLNLTKLSAEKVIILNELSELLISLKRIDMDCLNKFYLQNCKSIRDRIELPTAIGIKYNIMSAQSQISMINSNNESIKHNDINNPIEHDINNFDMNKYYSILKGYENDFKESIDKNLRRLRILEKGRDVSCDDF
jgi:hypothetical protein